MQRKLRAYFQSWAFIYRVHSGPSCHPSLSSEQAFPAAGLELRTTRPRIKLIHVSASSTLAQYVDDCIEDHSGPYRAPGRQPAEQQIHWQK